MKRIFPYKMIIISVLLCLPTVALSQEAYIFERMWPAQQLSWTFLIPNGMAFDKQGNLYVVDSKTDHIVKLTQNGFYITSWGGSGDGDGEFSVPHGIALDDQGNVYVTEKETHRVQKFDSEGTFITKWGQEGTGQGDFDTPNGIVADKENNIYVADVNNNRIQKFDSNGTYIDTLDGDLDRPHDVTVDSSNHVYVADTYNMRILKYTPEGDFVKQVGNTYPCPVIPCCPNLFSFPIDIDIDGEDQLYIAGLNDTIWKMDADENCVTSWGGSESFSNLNSMAIDESGYVYAADFISIQKFTADGEFIIRWSSIGSDPGEFNLPEDVAIDTEGYVYVADGVNYRVQKFTPDGQYVTHWGEQGNGDEQFDSLWGIAAGPDNTVFVVDPDNRCIRKFTSSGEFLVRWGEYGTGEGQFQYPAAIAVDMDGNVFVTDIWPNEIPERSIQKFRPTPDGTGGINDSGYEFETSWGETVFEMDPQEGNFRPPVGIAVDGGGNVYVTDQDFTRVQKFSPASDGSGYEFVTDWGEFGSNPGQFLSPHAIAVDSESNVYVTDKVTGFIQKFDADGNYITRWGGIGSVVGKFEHPRGIAVNDNGNTVYVSDQGLNRIQVFRKFDDTLRRPRAIIVAGGGPYPGNSLWDATRMTANFAYMTLLSRGFTGNDIYYLTSDTDLDLDNNGVFDEVTGLSDDVYALPTNGSLQQAITEAAHGDDDENDYDNAQNLVLYLTDHGNDLAGGTFYLNEQHEPLIARDLALWLGNVEDAIAGEIVVVYDGCQSGSFIDDLSGENRIVVTSARWYEQAKFLNRGTISFSSFFWTNIFNRFSVGASYDWATGAINSYFSNQNPQLAGSAEDFYITFFPGDNQSPETVGAPTIGAVTEHITLEIPDNSDASADLYAYDVIDPDGNGISRVWGEIRPPDLSLGLVSEPLIGQLDTIELTVPSEEDCPPEENCYKGTFNRFEKNGLYRIAIYAMDGKGNVSEPQLIPVSLNDTVMRKAIIIAGEDDADQGPASDMIEVNSALAYNALISQGFEGICLLSVSGIPGLEDVPFSEPTVENLRTCLNDAQSGAGGEYLDLVIYITGKGTPEAVILDENSGEVLSALELAELLNNLQNNSRVTLIYDGNHSGSFIPVLTPPAGMERILITSSGENEKAYFNQDGNISFSHFFWGQASIGATLYVSFGYAKNAIAYFNRREEISFSCYRERGPRLEANEESPPNEAADYAIARERTIGIGQVFADDNAPPPTIGSAWVEEIKNGDEVVTGIVIAAENIICYSGEIEKVWAVLKSVDYCPGAPGEQDAEEPQKFELSVTDGEGQYESLPISYGDLPGTYKILVYASARDEAETISVSSPRETSFYRVEGGDIYEDPDGNGITDDVDSEANVIVINHATSQPHNFYRAGDVDWVKFYAITTYSNPQTNEPVPYTYRIKAGNLGENCKPVIELYHEDNLIAATAYDMLEVGDEVLLELELDESGDGMYYIKLRNLHNPDGPYDGAHTDYELQVDNEDAGGLLVLITGRVEDRRSGGGIDGALVKTNGGGSAISVGGSYDLYQKPGDWRLTATATTYESFTKSITVNTGGGFIPIDISMLPRTTAAPGECSEDEDCDDGLFCNGVEACVDGACLEGSNPCTAPLTCDEENDVCTGCERDADCGDSLFCNGVETCVDGNCQDGTGPCPEGVTCDEDNDECKLASVLITPGSLLQSRWLPLLVFLRIQGTDTHFDASTEVTFSPDSVRALPMVANQETMFCLGLLMPSWITGPNGDSITVTIKTGPEEVSGTVEISLFSFLPGQVEETF